MILIMCCYLYMMKEKLDITPVLYIAIMAVVFFIGLQL